ncbi:hypothetical protein [Brevibacillus daliensis]|uniref:hypothetical protein n=1 Tax=Brevibacillus daliensis TaxID=2892995 RepID=UPI001E581866|nr:hypothetical protein [Brevibacillus daliensis]
MDNLDQELKQRKILVHQSFELSEEELKQLELRTISTIRAHKNKRNRSHLRIFTFSGIAVAILTILLIGPRSFFLQKDEPNQVSTPLGISVTQPLEVPTSFIPLPDIQAPPLAWQTEQDKLALFQVFSIGMTYSEAKELFPELGELTSIFGSDSSLGIDLQEATMPVSLGKNQALLTLSFNKGSLYAARYQRESRNEQEINHEKDRLITSYSSVFGNPQEEQIENGTSVTWSPFFGLALTKNYDGRYFLGWGLQFDESLDEMYRNRIFTVQEAIEKAMSKNSNNQESPAFPSRPGDSWNEEMNVTLGGKQKTLATATLRTKVKLQATETYLVTFEKEWITTEKKISDKPIKSFTTYRVTKDKVEMVENNNIDEELKSFLLRQE